MIEYCVGVRRGNACNSLQIAAKLQGLFVDTDAHMLLDHLMASVRERKVDQG